MKYLLLPLLYIVTVLLTPTTVSAQNLITVTPAFQEITLEKDQAATSSSVTIENTTTQPITLEILPSNVDQENLSGQLSMEVFSGATNQTFPYLSFSNDRFVVPPGGSQTVDVTVSSHSTLKTGGTYVGIVFRMVQDDQPTDDQVLLPGVACLLLIKKIGGETYNLSLSNVRGIPKVASIFMPKVLGLIFSNNGNVHVQPRGTITVTGLFDRLIAQSTINESSAYILPGRQRLLQQPLKPSSPALPIDFLNVDIVGSSGENRTPYSFSTSFIFISPWVLLGIALLFSVLMARVIIKHPKLNK